MYSERYLQSLSMVLQATEATSTGESLTLQAGLEAAVHAVNQARERRGAQHFLGNGASAAIAEHMALDWTKNGGLRSTSPSSWVLLTALANDLGYEDTFGTYVNRYCQASDIVVTISSSGNSPNILRAINVAREQQCFVMTFSGLKPDNNSRALGDLNFYVPAKTYGIVECAHQVLLHMILDAVMGIQEWDRDTVQDMNVKSFQL